MSMKTIAPKSLAAPISVVWLYAWSYMPIYAYMPPTNLFSFQLRAEFLSLAPSSAKGYYATDYTLQACMCRTKRAWAVREIAN